MEFVAEVGVAADVMAAGVVGLVAPEANVGLPQLVSRSVKHGMILNPEDQLTDKVAIDSLIPGGERVRLRSYDLYPCGANEMQRDSVVQVQIS